MPRISSSALTLVIGCLAIACSDDEPAGPAPLSFATDIHPIFVEKCGGCHVADGDDYFPEHAAPDVEEAYASTTSRNRQGEFFYNRILARTQGEGGGSIMPPPPLCEGGLDEPGCLTTSEHELIQQWVDEGAQP